MSTNTLFGTKVPSSGISQQQSFVVQLPDDGTLVPKHVGVGT